MYKKPITFHLPTADYERLRALAHNTHGTLTGLLREGTTLVIAKYKSDSVKKGSLSQKDN